MEKDEGSVRWIKPGAGIACVLVILGMVTGSVTVEGGIFLLGSILLLALILNVFMPQTVGPEDPGPVHRDESSRQDVPPPEKVPAPESAACPQCGAAIGELAPGAGACPSCGASLSSSEKDPWSGYDL